MALDVMASIPLLQQFQGSVCEPHVQYTTSCVDIPFHASSLCMLVGSSTCVVSHGSKPGNKSSASKVLFTVAGQFREQLGKKGHEIAVSLRGLKLMSKGGCSSHQFSRCGAFLHGGVPVAPLRGGAEGPLLAPEKKTIRSTCVLCYWALGCKIGMH